MNKVGRPTIYSNELAEEICNRIANGESVRSIGRDNKMPTASTIFEWALHNDTFSEQYAKAKEIGIEIESEDLEEIARTENDVARAKLIVDTKKWVMSKKLPKKYGDKMDVTSDNKQLPTPILNLDVLSNPSNREDSETE